MGRAGLTAGQAGVTALSTKTLRLQELASPHAEMLLTIALPLGSGVRGLGTPWEGLYLLLFAHSFAILSSHFLLKQNSSL
jgi:hypothetical protein